MVERPPTNSGRPPLTPAELEILATPDEELRKASYVFSFDRIEFQQRVSAGDRWQQLIQAHLYFDHVLTQMIIESLANSDSLNVLRMSFIQKIEMIDAMGLAHRDIIYPIKFINTLRNKIAHDLNAKILDKDENDLKNITPKFTRSSIAGWANKPASAIVFHELLMALLFQLEIIRQGNIFNKIRNYKGEIRLRAVLDRNPEANYRE